MSQIKVFLDFKTGNMITTSEEFKDMGIRLISAVEEAFGISGRDDVAFDIFKVLYTQNEAPVQIEVLYTAGTDEYGTGQIFDPDEDMKARAVELILKGFNEFLWARRIGSIVPSVWIRPQYKSVFKPGKVE